MNSLKRAPLSGLFEAGRADEEHSVEGTLSYADGPREVAIQGASVSVRGHTSRREDECTFPKLKVKFAAAEALENSRGLQTQRIGTHCGQLRPGELTRKFGRLANEDSPRREALVYRLVEAAGAPAPRTRPARITYVDMSSTPPDTLVRPALLVEDDDDALKRLDATGQLSKEAFGNAQQRFTPEDAARLAFAEAMVGNFPGA